MPDNALVIQAAAASPIIRYHWIDRGVAPVGYTKGMAAAFAESYRKLKANDRFLIAATRSRAHNLDHDVLDHYAAELKAARAADDTPCCSPQKSGHFSRCCLGRDELAG